MSDTTNGAGANRLRKNSLSTGAVTFLVVSAAAPLTAVAGGVPLSMLLGNGAGIPGAFLIVTAILLIFAVGYVAMARHVNNAGAFYAFAARGLGGGSGGASALIALLSYNCMQIGVLGLLGAATSGVFASFGLTLPWWLWSYVAIALVAVFGYRSVDLSAKVLTVLVVLEYVVVLIFDFAVIGKGGDAGLSMAPFTMTQVMSGVPAIGILFCFAAFIGFEATTIYSEEAKTPETTVPRATYISVLIIGVFYMFTSWLMVNAAGVDKLVPEIGALADPTSFLFVLSDRYVGGWLTQIMTILFVTSLFAGVLAFHNGVARYMYVAGREKLLPASVGVTHPRFQSPHVGSVIQTILAVIVVGIFAYTGQDPVLALFSWLTNVGTLGIVVLMAVTSISVVAFFRKNPEKEPNVLKALILPAVAAVALVVTIYQIVINFGNLSGTSGFLGILLPGLVAIAAVIGFFCATALKARSPANYAMLGSQQF
jgi:amino acid transporter